MSMVSMKMSPKEVKAMEPTISETKPEYPYGLRISLNKESMEKLGMSLPGIGDKVSIQAVGEIVAFSQYESDGHKNKSCDIQIEELQIGSKKEEKDASKSLYGE